MEETKKEPFCEICWVSPEAEAHEVGEWLTRIGFGNYRNRFLVNQISGSRLYSLELRDLLDMGVEPYSAADIKDKISYISCHGELQAEHELCKVEPIESNEWVKVPWWGKEQVGKEWFSNQMILVWVFPVKTNVGKNWKSSEDCQQQYQEPRRLVSETSSNPFPRIYIPPSAPRAAYVRASMVNVDFKPLSAADSKLQLLKYNTAEVTSWNFIKGEFKELVLLKSSEGRKWRIKFELCDENGEVIVNHHPTYSDVFEVVSHSKYFCRDDPYVIEELIPDCVSGSSNLIAMLGSFTQPIRQIKFGSLVINPECITYVDSGLIVVKVTGAQEGTVVVQIKNAHESSNLSQCTFLPRSDNNSGEGGQEAVKEKLFGGFADSSGLTKLHWACIQGNLERVIQLLKDGADINEIDNLGFTPLYRAVWEENDEVVEVLLSLGADPNIGNFKNFVPLHRAAFVGSTRLTELLLKSAADPCHQNCYGDSPLDVSDDPEVIAMLRKYGAKSQNDSSVEDHTSGIQIQKLPDFLDVLPVKRQELFAKKIQQCCILFDFRRSDQVEAKQLKMRNLLDVTNYLVSTSGVITEAIYPDVFNMISANIFRPLPVRKQPPGVLYDPEQDDPITEPAWAHLQVVYEFFLRFVDSSEFNVDLARPHLNAKFLKQMLGLFDSEDVREREYLKTLLHRIYGKCISYRALIRQEISNIFCTFIFETQEHNGIAELLELLGSIINGFVVPLKRQHKDFMKNVLLPLYKGNSYSCYFSQLTYCVMQLIEKDPSLTTMTVNAILRAWPRTKSKKAVLFIAELQELIHISTPDVIPISLWVQLAKCAQSEHFMIADKTLAVLTHEETMATIADCFEDVIPVLAGPLYDNTRGHWHKAVAGLSYNMLRLFMDLDLQLFNRCIKEYNEREKKVTLKRHQMEEEWKKLEEKFGDKRGKDNNA